MTITRLITALALACCLVPAQMEKRWAGRYDGRNFAGVFPAIGSLAPDLVLKDLDGRMWSLREQLGSTIVLVKAAYT